MLTVAVWGATGYAGQELVRFLGGHPQIRTIRAYSRNPEPRSLAALYPSLQLRPETRNITLATADPDDASAFDVDVVFCALPHGASAPIVATAIKAGCRVIDLGADFRLRDSECYRTWYGHEHPVPELLTQAVYGLPEWVDRLYGNPRALVEAQLVAAPGCYPTGALLAILPLLAADLIDPQSIVIDSKSGTSGAGRSPGDALSFSEVAETVRPYKVASHRHTPEIEQALTWVAGEDRKPIITFTPHLVPMPRGILSTCYASLQPGVTQADVEAAFRQAYDGAAFVHRAPEGQQPETKWVKGTNGAFYQWVVDERTGRIIVTTAIDNLGKGAAGQAVQCLNLMFGFDETAGLAQGGFLP